MMYEVSIERTDTKGLPKSSTTVFVFDRKDYAMRFAESATATEAVMSVEVWGIDKAMEEESILWRWSRGVW